MKSWLIPLGCAVLFSVAQAQDTPPPGKGSARQACKPDYEKFCKDAKPGGGRIKACMEQHKDELSQACRDVMDSHGGHSPAGGSEDQPPPPPKSQ
jgi:Cysteine rich repeat